MYYLTTKFQICTVKMRRYKGTMIRWESQKIFNHLYSKTKNTVIRLLYTC